MSDIQFNTIYNEDCLETMRRMPDGFVDLVLTDPPYGYSFMGKDWDKAVPSVEVWRECLRVLKPGAFCLVMSAPRSDVQCTMISRLQEAGFRLDFTPIYWTYASGFPKAGNIGKLVDKRLGAERKKLPNPKAKQQTQSIGTTAYGDYNATSEIAPIPVTAAAKALDGSYAGFQPKPAVEVIIVAMKPLSEKTFVDQALKNGKGITWLDDARIPFTSDTDKTKGTPASISTHRFTGNSYNGGKEGNLEVMHNQSDQGRFPANLLVSDDVLNDGVEHIGTHTQKPRDTGGSSLFNMGANNGAFDGGKGSYSRYFDLDKWAQTLPFLIVPKASKSEKNHGLEDIQEQTGNRTYGEYKGTPEHSPNTVNKTRNHHPTVKPLKLMSYLITLGSRKGDTVLDPFVGSGTVVVAAEQLGRVGIGIEREPEYVEIASARLAAEKKRLKQEVLL